MTTPSVDETTQFLTNAANGDPAAAEKLLPLVYQELRALAAHYLRGERVGHTLQPTALVHEAYLKLVKTQRVDFNGRSHFLAVAASTMRRVLVDHARRRRSLKRGLGRERVALREDELSMQGTPTDMLALDEALSRLEALDNRCSRVVELRYFGGMTVEEAAAALGVSKRTVEDDWAWARTWLYQTLSEGSRS